MKLLPYAIGAVLISTAIACDNSQDIGSSIIQDEVAVVIDSAYTLTGQSVECNRIQSRTATQMLGAIDARGFGRFTSDFVTQFMAAGSIDTENIRIENIDSLQLMMAVPVGGYIGDSITPMGLTVYELTRQLPSPIYSDFDPKDYYDPSKPIATQIYSCNALGLNDTVQAYKYRFIYAKLPLELGRRLFQAYLDNPASYLEPSSFAQIFPGLYITNSYGSGRVIKIDGNSMRLFYHYTAKTSDGRDTIYNRVGNYYSVTPEIITNNCIDYTMSADLRARAAAGQNIIVAPLGYDVKINFPLPQMLARYRDNAGALTVVNSLSLDIPIEEIANTYGITPPPYLLLVLSSRRDEFFANNQVTDEKYSFYAPYDPINRRYRFPSLRDYFLTMLDKGDELTPDDYTFTLTPVDVVTEAYSSSYSSAYYINSIAPYVATPVMARLMLENAKIKITYSRQSLNF